VTDETTNPNRWAAELVNGGGGLAWLRLTSGDAVVNTAHLFQADAESLAEQINRPAPTAPADDLPVTRPCPLCSGDRLVPNPLSASGWSPCRCNSGRIPAKPATEWVPWWEAKGRNRNHLLTVIEVGCDKHGPWIYDGNGRTYAAVNADGKVEVQR
jgi:hypothetical protein